MIPEATRMLRTRLFYQQCFACFVIAFFFSLSLQTQSLHATAPLQAGFTADQLFLFAEQLMHEGEYFRAITEYQRFLELHPEDPRRAMVHFRIGLALYRGQQYQEALQTFQEVAQHYPQTEYGQKARLWQGESLLRLSSYGAAEQLYGEIARQFVASELGQYATFQKAWTLLYRRKWQQASQQFRQIDARSQLYPEAQMLAEEVLAGKNIAHKSPWIAGLLSGVLPGSGQLYNERPGDALLAFFLNGLFAVGIVESFQQDQQAIAIVLGIFEAGWYVGNVYGAVNGAHKYNRYATETFLRNLENRFRHSAPEAQQSPGRGGMTFLRLGF